MGQAGGADESYARTMEITRTACVGAIIRDQRGRLLLVRRGTEPGLGRWSVPGGRVEPGEGAWAAVIREVREETDLHVTVDALAGVVERPGLDGEVYVIEDFYAQLEPGSDPRAIHAGDDADDVGWFYPEQVVTMDCVDGLVDALRQWRVLPRT